MICTERYVEKADGAIGGVGYEKMIVTQNSSELGYRQVHPSHPAAVSDRKSPGSWARATTST